ncbi:unnamed protein product [Polarella glacialis]|uniref:Uncharacterized protein n=1 Tax=Polarella glacialis TaxID=89957 RepID=A0A813I2Q3_POLGL|nr:unnamed protein product [Polarella glacialis]
MALKPLEVCPFVLGFGVFGLQPAAEPLEITHRRSIRRLAWSAQLLVTQAVAFYVPLPLYIWLYIFVENDKDLKETIIAYTKMEKKFMRKDKLAAQNEKLGSGLNFYAKPLLGAMVTGEWNVIAPEDIPKMKDFPTKLELIAKIAGGIQMVTTKIAKGIKQVPTKLAIGTKKVQEKMEEDGKSTVGDVAV